MNKIKKITIERFKKECVEVIDELREDGDHIFITKRGKMIAELRGFRRLKRNDDFFDSMKGKGRVTGDIISPVLCSED